MKPKAITVFVTVQPNGRNGLTKPFGARIGACDTVDEAKAMIANDRREMNDTLGGLIDAPGSSRRTYQVFRAEWNEVRI